MLILQVLPRQVQHFGLLLLLLFVCLLDLGSDLDLERKNTKNINLAPKQNLLEVFKITFNFNLRVPPTQYVPKMFRTLLIFIATFIFCIESL